MMTTRHRALLRGPTPWLGLALLIGMVRPAAAEDFATAEAAYREALARPSLYKRMQGRARLARTRDPQVLQVFARDYARAEDPSDHVRYLLATIATQHLVRREEYPEAYAAWRAQAREPTDMWLWYRTLVVDRRLQGSYATDTALAPAQPALLRAAALHALATVGDPDAPQVVASLLTRLPAADPDRWVVLEACSAATRGWRTRLGDEVTRACVEQLARMLDDAKLAPATRDVLCRNLAWLFGTDLLGGSSEPWLRELAAAAAGPGARPAEPQYAEGPFFGLPSEGRRVVFAIDASDSMLAPLGEDELRRLRPVTPSTDAPPPKRGGGKKAKDPEEPIPWHRVRNRWDAAREVLKLSLRRLEPDQVFCVVLFGDRAETLSATPGLRPADAKGVAAAVKELDAIQPTPAPGDERRPHGALRGETNVHGALRLAFRVGPKAAMGPGEYVDLSRTGCDVVYLLSDGVPTTDDFPMEDKRDGEGAVTDRETMTPTEAPPTLEFPGPYGWTSFEGFDHITEDARRLTMVRQAPIHCVAVGEADDALLKRIATLSCGRFRRVGAKK